MQVLDLELGNVILFYILRSRYNFNQTSEAMQVLDLRTWTWSKVDVKAEATSEETSPLPLPPRAGHSLVGFAIFS